MNHDPADIMFRVVGLPVSAPRQVNRDRFMPSDHVLRYRAWKDLVRIEAKKHFRQPWEGAVALSAVFLMPIPQSWTKARKDAAVTDRIIHVSKPDLDNLVKALKDALNGVAWKDDTQVWAYVEPLCKLYAPREQCGAQVRIVMDEADLTRWPDNVIALSYPRGIQ